MITFTIGSVPYLNARPLTEWFEATDEGRASCTDLSFAVPSALAKPLEAGTLDAALISSIAWVRRPHLTYAPGIAVASEGPVRSVRLLSQVPAKKIKRVALDGSSMTSVTLTRILLEEHFQLTPEYTVRPPDLSSMLAEADAALLIGDPGNLDYDPNLLSIDLGETWSRWTGLPFVYALWVGAPERLTPERLALLTRAKEWGLENRADIAARRGPEHGQSPERALSYMTEAIRYNLGEREEAGLHLFAQKARAHGLA
ncbi:MAG: menaquinone biosynthesis protein [Armatimonas sp.]